MNNQLDQILNDERCSLAISPTIRGGEYFETTFTSKEGTLHADGFWTEDEALDWLIERRDSDDKDI